MIRAIDVLAALSLTGWWPVRTVVLVATLLTVALVLRHARRVTAVLLATALLAGLVTVNLLLARNAYYASYPTLGALDGPASPAPVPAAPTTGTTLVREIPATQPGFAPRPTLVYLPRATVDPDTPRPVLVLLHDSAGSPRDWLDRGGAGRLLDEWATRNGGIPPILVLPDVTGRDGGPACPGPLETYLTRDVAAFVLRNYTTVAPGAGWAVAGQGAGGSCAVALALRNPAVFATFADFGGPRVGPPFAPDLVSLLRDLGRPEIGGWFATGDGEPAAVSATAVLYVASQQGRLDGCFALRQGEGPGYDTAGRALADTLPWIVARANRTPQLDLKRACMSVGP